MNSRVSNLFFHSLFILSFAVLWLHIMLIYRDVQVAIKLFGLWGELRSFVYFVVFHVGSFVTQPSSCFLCLSCEVIHEVLLIFSDALFNLLVGFRVSDLGFCFLGSCSSAVQYLLHLLSGFYLLQSVCTCIGHVLFGLPSQRFLSCLPPCISLALLHLVDCCLVLLFLQMLLFSL